ncbi:MAG: hypothetical protein HQK51_20255, partial [Oligoflexia bacterium]|nr:hypothetical protein [Oligoflexia bacterium]
MLTLLLKLNSLILNGLSSVVMVVNNFGYSVYQQTNHSFYSKKVNQIVFYELNSCMQSQACAKSFNQENKGAFDLNQIKNSIGDGEGDEISTSNSINNSIRDKNDFERKTLTSILNSINYLNKNSENQRSVASLDTKDTNLDRNVTSI